MFRLNPYSRAVVSELGDLLKEVVRELEMGSIGVVGNDNQGV